jgi:hypothetical protein
MGEGAVQKVRKLLALVRTTSEILIDVAMVSKRRSGCTNARLINTGLTHSRTRLTLIVDYQVSLFISGRFLAVVLERSRIGSMS